MSQNANPWMEAMLAGDFEAAWRETDAVEIPRRQRAGQGESAAGEGLLRWDGTPFAGHRILVNCEHGLGDTIQFARFFPKLREAGARSLTVRVQPALLDLFCGLDGVDRWVDAWTCDPEPDHDVAIECMELAYAFRSTPETLPPPALPMARLRERAREFDLGPGPRIGLLWAASAWDPSRSIELGQLAPFGRVPGLRFFSLQQGPQADDAATAPFSLTVLSDRTRAVADAAAAMLAMDLIICVDGMPAHLAGALGRPVWLLLSHTPDWRWMRDRPESPWYPGMRLFRQPAPGDWASPIEAAGRQLAAAYLASKKRDLPPGAA